jgi:farnesyl-diphosphate farnesyltransferase
VSKVIESKRCIGKAAAVIVDRGEAGIENDVSWGQSAPLHAAASSAESDDAFQARMLAGVSRTFALTIPQLPPALARVISNAYLLCRTVDTIEDEPDIAAQLKSELCTQFVAALRGTQPAHDFSRRLAPLLSQRSSPAEHELIEHAERVVAITHRCTPSQQEALIECVAVMSAGMVKFQEEPPHGLPDLAALDRYCYHVAGVVGEMLTKLFCEYSPDIARHRATMLELAVAFGQGLQMTNILKDIWEDRERGMCWLPRDVFARAGFDLDQLAGNAGNPAFVAGMRHLIAIAHGHLHSALRYTLLIPAREAGIRNFCLWSIGMALLTLRKIHHHPDFGSGREVKISRRSVRATVLASRLCARNDPALRWLFSAAAAGLPVIDQAQRRS